MILDQNTIVLNPCNGFYDEYTLVSTDQAKAQTPAITTPISILPGAVVGQKTVDPLYDAKKYPFLTKAQFDAKLAEAKAKQAGTYKKPGSATAEPSDGGEALEAFYAKYPRQHVITAGYTGEGHVADGAPEGTDPDGAANADDLDAVEVLILVENALLGKGICALYFPGEVTPVYSPVSGDRYLARCVPGTYTEGQPLYLCDWNPTGAVNADGYKIKGYYFCGASYSGVKSKEIKAFAGEDFICPDATKEDRKPYPFFLDGVDDSTTERPATINLNGALTNLLRVRMA